MYYHLSFNDLIFTPIYLSVILGLVYLAASKIKDRELRKYFLNGIFLKFIGAISLGLIYEFVYDGGDTSAYFTNGKIVSGAFYDSPSTWLKLLLQYPEDETTTQYIKQLTWYTDRASYFPSRIVALLGPFCFNTYSIIALFFAIISFNGLWHLFIVFKDIYPKLQREIAISIFYVPSLFFWGSGIMKDPLVLAGLGWFVYAFYFGLVKRIKPVKCIVLACMGLYLLLYIKPYVIAAFFPPMAIWMYMLGIKRVKDRIVRIMVGFIFFILLLITIPLFINYMSATSGYEFTNIDAISKKIEITSEWIERASGQEGSSYSLGELDGTVSGTLALAPQAIVVSLFRPFLWEVRNPVMLLAALESTWLLITTLYILFKVGLFKSIWYISKDPTLILCFLFSIIFAAFVGLSSGNFGTLVRYKIPLIPFYMCGIFILLTKIPKTDVKKKSKKS